MIIWCDGFFFVGGIFIAYITLAEDDDDASDNGAVWDGIFFSRVEYYLCVVWMCARVCVYILRGVAKRQTPNQTIKYDEV